MAGLEIYCCRDKVGCRSFKEGKAVNFKYIRQKKGRIPVGEEVNGICWVFLLSGRIKISKGQEELTVDGGEMFIIPSSGYNMIAEEEAELVVFVSDCPTEYCTSMLKGLSDNFSPGKEGIVKMVVHAPLDQFIDLLLVYLRTGIACGYLFEEKQEELFILMNKCYTRPELAGFLYSLYVRKNTDLKKFIEDHCARAKNARDLAELCGYSVGGFKRVFKELFNEPVYRWMLQRKADCLKERLAEENVNLKFIINEFGFSSPAHFTKFCKQWLGMVPTKYIEEVRKRQEQIEL